MFRKDGDFMKFVWEKYFPWYFLADLVIWSAVIGGILYWVTR